MRLIVNADDFGYFDEVSRGILELATQGIVTATGVMANGPALPRWVDALRRLPLLSVGVHLNATLGKPLTQEMRGAVHGRGGLFPGKGTMAAAILRGGIATAVVIAEWRAQIRHVIDAGLAPCFVNSHEHLHMLPQLYARTRELAREFGIVHVRAPRAEWGPAASVGGYVRSGAFAMARLMAGPSPGEPELIGLNPSGHLNLSYCRWRFGRLRQGSDYELMCHPGRDDAHARGDPKLGAYHDWEGELHTLQSPEFADLLRQHRIALTGYARGQKESIS